MALSSSLVLKDNAAANVTFTENRRNGYRVERLDVATSTAVPRKLVVDHSTTTGPKGILNDRHLIQVTSAELDASGNLATTVVNLTISIPRNASGSTPAKHCLAAIASLLMTTGAANVNFDAVLQNQS